MPGGERCGSAGGGPWEALLRVHRVGVCGTDFHAFHGRQAFFTYPRVMGHELGAEVVEAPPNDRGMRPGTAAPWSLT